MNFHSLCTRSQSRASGNELTRTVSSPSLVVRPRTVPPSRPQVPRWPWRGGFRNPQTSRVNAIRLPALHQTLLEAQMHLSFHVSCDRLKSTVQSITYVPPFFLLYVRSRVSVDRKRGTSTSQEIERGLEDRILRISTEREKCKHFTFFKARYIRAGL